MLLFNLLINKQLQAVDPTDVVLTEATVELTLTDVNDENPVFIAVPEDCQVLENSGANTGFYNCCYFQKKKKFKCFQVVQYNFVTFICIL